MKGRVLGVIRFGLVLAVWSAVVSPGVVHGKSKSDAFAILRQQKPAQAKQADPFPDVLRITAEEVQRLAKNGAQVVMVDTDDPVAYESEHIKGAVNIPYDPTRDAHEQDQTLSALPGDRLVVFYCNCAHEEDSAPLVQEMWELGYDHAKVKALKGGLAHWEHLKFPLAGSDVKPSEPTNP